MDVVVSLFADGQWELLKTTAAAGTPVVGIMNPASGPGTLTDPSYTTAINDVKSSGAQVHTGVRRRTLSLLFCFCFRTLVGFWVKSEDVRD